MTAIFVQELQERPATIAHILFMILIFLYQYDYDVRADKFGQEFDRVTKDREWWRCLTSTYSHNGLLHLLMNMLSLWYLGPIEPYFGSLGYMRYTLLLVVLSQPVMLGIQWLERRYRSSPPGLTYTAGYSGVLFGWLAVTVIKLPFTMNLFGINLPSYVMLFVYLGLAQLILPNVSWQGHVSGVVIGLLIGGGVFDWFGNYLALCLLIWVLIAFLVSLKLTHRFEMRYIQILDADDVEQGNQRRMVDGQLVYDNQPAVAPGADEPL